MALQNLIAQEIKVTLLIVLLLSQSIFLIPKISSFFPLSPSLLPTILLISVTPHSVVTSTSTRTSILSTLRVWSANITTRGSPWAGYGHATSGVRRAASLWWVWTSIITSNLAPATWVVTPTLISVRWVPVWTSRWTMRLSIVVVTRSRIHLGLCIAHGMIRPMPMWSLTNMLDGRQAGMLLRMMYFLPLC